MNEVVLKEKKKFYKTWYGISLIVLCFILLISSFNSSKNPSEPISKVGAPVSLSTQTGDCSGDILLGRNKLTTDRLIQLSRAKDNIGVAEMVLKDQAFFVSGCTPATVIDVDYSNAISEVRIMGGENVGESGWIPYEWAKKIQ